MRAWAEGSARSVWVRWALVALVWLGAADAAGQAPLLDGFGGAAGFGMNALPPSDDGSSDAIDLTAAFPGGLRFFSATHTRLFVNNNGNITFSGPVATWTPIPFPVAAQPMIAPFWGDVDTSTGRRDGTMNAVYWHLEPGRFVATWYYVGYFWLGDDRTNSFQLILTDQSRFGAAGDFDVEFRYNRCQWTTGDESGGTGGLGGIPAQAGFDAGDTMNYQVLPGSRTAAVLALCTTSNVEEPGVWRFQVRSGAVTECGNGVIELGEDCDDGDAAPGDGCSARCAFEHDLGEACVEDDDCRSGFCTDGVCCDARCDGQCEACSQADRVGACTAVSGEPVGSRPACDGAGTVCGATCDGITGEACTYPDASTSCHAFCTVGATCDGAGACAGGAPRDCSDGLDCTVDACDEASRSCQSSLSAGCTIDGACVTEGASSPDDACLVCDPSQSTSGYSPSNAAECQSVDGGRLADGGQLADGGHLADAGVVGRTAGGCGCRVSAAPSGASLGLLFIAALALGRRRRR